MGKNTNKYLVSINLVVRTPVVNISGVIKLGVLQKILYKLFGLCI